MREKLSLQGIMSHFRERWANLPDKRKPNNNTKYEMADGVLAAFAVFFMQSSSFLAHQRLLQSKKGRSNARSLFQVEEIPSDPQIRNLLDPLSSEDFQEDFWFLLDELEGQQGLWQFRNDLNTYTVALDGVNFFFFGEHLLPEMFETSRSQWYRAFLSQRHYARLRQTGAGTSFTPATGIYCAARWQ
jgi:hypothetical protein